MSGTTGFRNGVLLSELAGDARNLAERLASQDDWMSQANAESALALSKLAKDAEAGAFAVEELTAPLFAALGAADLALATVNDLLAELRERAEETRTDTRSRVEESRARLTKLQEDLPETAARPARPVHRRRAAQRRGGLRRGRDLALRRAGRARRGRPRAPAQPVRSSTTPRRAPRATSTRRSS
jgi:signal transduction histidine kinase